MHWRGELSDAPVLSVPAGPPMLWRASVLDTYDGQSWYAGHSGVQVLGSGTAVAVPTPDDPPTRTGRTRSDLVRPAGRPYDPVVAPGRPIAVNTAQRVLSTDGTVYLAPPGKYTVTSAVPEAGATALRAATGPDPADARWTDLPPGLPDRVTALGRRVAGKAPTRYDAVRAVEQYLRGHATYRLDSRVPDPGEDAVDAFLFADRTGFCEQFAAAEVVLLRSAGIPARLVTGFSGGEPAGDRRVLREADAHAWAEVWFPDIGWVSSDPTAGAALAEVTRNWTAEIRAVLTTLLATARGRLELAAGLAIAVLVALVLVRLRSVRVRSARTRAPTGPAGATPPDPGRGPLLTAYRRWEAALTVAGASRRPDEGLEDLAARNPAAASALRTVGRGLYAPTAPSLAESREAIEALDRLSAKLLASVAPSAAPEANREGESAGESSSRMTRTPPESPFP
jgi:transglutaminase-like putative cysteine protease